ncbi:chemotaxis protein CheD [Alkalibacillus flavidus]|uniref:Probable chemoreceptor glutamine deamidase CheD n=1 Tax=Alkalibacillus flavidus TaxID=546021 RepID=A0ABV2KRE2_9BACI
MTQVTEVVKVGIADLNIAKHPQTIMTAGLGSCIGLILYDETSKIAGLVHVMLPDSSMARNKSFKEAKFADTGIEALLSLLEKEGVRKSRLKAKMAGGAQMFNTANSSEMMRIGYRNAEAVRAILKEHKIPLIAEDCGGNKGRTVEFLLDQSLLKIRTIQEGVTYI